MLQDEWLEETGQQAIVWGSDDMLGLDAYRIGKNSRFSVILCCECVVYYQTKHGNCLDNCRFL